MVLAVLAKELLEHMEGPALGCRQPREHHTSPQHMVANQMLDSNRSRTRVGLLVLILAILFAQALPVRLAVAQEMGQRFRDCSTCPVINIT